MGKTCTSLPLTHRSCVVQVEALNEELEFAQLQQQAAQAVIREATAATKQRSEFTLEQVLRPLSFQNMIFPNITVSQNPNLGQIPLADFR